MKRIRCILATLLLLVTSSLIIQAQPGKDIINKLTAFSVSHTTEKAYLHFDKPYYATGDTVYFKAYVTIGERLNLSHLSGILHVDLINTTNKIDQSIKLQLVNGLGWGDFALPDSLPAGNYRIRAYSQWMRNDGNYFERVIPVGSVHDQNIPESSTAHKNTDAKADLQFFPEGGSLVSGIPSKIAFKAIGPNGLGVAAKGILVDNAGQTITQFASVRLGMGAFSFKPEDGKTYKANITFADGSKDVLDLPMANTKGITLAVNNDSLSKASVKIQASKAWYNENKGKDYTLLIYSGGLATTVNFKLDSMVINLDIIKRRLHTGITRVTLFSAANEPLCERMLFVQNYDQLGLNVITDKSTYRSREKVSIRLNAKNRADSAAVGHFSVAVIDESKVPVEENTESTILTDLLLTSDLKGTVEQPNYYFTNINDEKLKELDLVMLTHGYRRFEWKQVLSTYQPPLAWQPERSLQISGTAKSLFGKPLAKAEVSLISFMPKSLISTVADDKGKFLFDNLSFPDTVRFVLQAVNAKGKNKTKLIYNPVAPVPVIPLPSILFNQNIVVPVEYLKNKQQEEFNLNALGKSIHLKEVKIKALKKHDQYETQSFAGAGHADQVMHAKEIEWVRGPLSISLDGRLRGVNFAGYFPYKVPVLGGGLGGPMLVVIDGVEGDDLNSINAGDVETIEVLKFASASMYGMQGGNGVLVVTTKRSAGTDWKDVAAIGILPITVQGYYKAREFYSPKYESNNITRTNPDLRSTIYWKPELPTDDEGHASAEFFNANGIGTYRVVVEGIDEKGNIGRQVYKYNVE